VALLLTIAAVLGAASPPTPPTVPEASGLNLPQLSAEPPLNLPGLAPEPGNTAAPFGAPGDGPEGEAMSQAEAQEAYDALTQALGENPLTQRAGAALAQGDADQAADDLRDLAAAADAIGPEARQQLADSLQRAAERIQGALPDTANELREAARGLVDGGPGADESAADALESLARLVESLDDARGMRPDQNARRDESGDGNAGSAGQGTAGREQQSAGSVERLQDDGQAFELPEGQAQVDDRVLQPPQNPGGATEQRDLPYDQGASSGSVGAGEQSADRLSLPWRLRNVIQRYFSPP
jgi:hypothetical protein